MFKGIMKVKYLRRLVSRNYNVRIYFLSISDKRDVGYFFDRGAFVEKAFVCPGLISWGFMIGAYSLQRP